MNKAVSDCLGKEQFNKDDILRFRLWSPKMRKTKFYKCPMCGKYHLTSKGIK